MTAEHDFDHESSVESGASQTYPAQCSSLRKGGFVVIKGRPCKIIDMSTSKTGKHGHAKVNMVATDIFNGKKYEEISPSTHNMDVPNVRREDYQLVDIEDNEILSLMDGNAEIRIDISLPEGELGGNIERDFNENSEKGFKEQADLMVTVLKAMGEEQIIAYKLVRNNDI